MVLRALLMRAWDFCVRKLDCCTFLSLSTSLSSSSSLISFTFCWAVTILLLLTSCNARDAEADGLTFCPAEAPRTAGFLEPALVDLELPFLRPVPEMRLFIPPLPPPALSLPPKAELSAALQNNLEICGQQRRRARLSSACL